MDTNFDPYTKRVLIAGATVLGFVLLALILQRVASVLLLIFAGILLAVFLDSLTSLVQARIGLARGWCLGLVVLLLGLAFAASGWFAGPPINDQINRLGERIPSAIERIQATVAQYEWVRSFLLGPSGSGQGISFSGQAMSFVAGGITNTIGALASGLVVLIIGLYAAATPSVYIDGAIRLLPPARRSRGREVVRALGKALRWWLLGRIASMAIVGALTAVGLWIAGIPLAFVLGLIAALLSFVPYIGPIASVVPAALVALADSPNKVLYVLVIYWAVQLLESYLITPLIQERAVSLPPAVLISAQVIIGILAGAIGVLMATPLAVVLIVLIQMLYVADTLGDSVPTLGE
ncbi:AI-2E family transporter [Longimonas halophila]|uniref:AI-2E family transporter n=1 Tax=Longimonas halophila TaxID=1469170 RepID=A0A2H3P5G4_9BACT|nr:AI-2E family transporter [Longimonas halophila]PEN07008.1 AI-2E family transporter [Longimonas halophila]